MVMMMISPPKTRLSDIDETDVYAMTDDFDFPDGVEMKIEQQDEKKTHPPLPRQLSSVGAIAVRRLVNDDFVSIAVVNENERVIERSCYHVYTRTGAIL